MFTLGLAYHLGGLKGLVRLDGNDPSARTVQPSAGRSTYLYIGPARTGEAARSR